MHAPLQLTSRLTVRDREVARVLALVSTAVRSRLVHVPPLVWPLLVLVAGTLLIHFTGADLLLTGMCYDAATNTWPLLEAEPWRFIYYYGQYPAIVMGIIALAVSVLAIAVKPFRPVRYGALFLALSVILGPGLVVNGILKPTWGRPRPCQVAACGGTEKFLPVWKKGSFTERRSHKSFPCGHASVGFSLLAPAFLLMRRHRKLAYLFIALGIAWGLTMGVGRVVQGRHFPSDVLWSAACIYFTCVLLYVAMGFGKADQTEADEEEADAAIIPLPQFGGDEFEGRRAA